LRRSEGEVVGFALPYTPLATTYKKSGSEVALTRCKECGGQVSTKATACPGCGARIVRTHCFTKLVLGFIVLSALLAGIGSQISEEAKKVDVAREAARRAALNPEQRAAEDRQQAAKLAAAGERMRQKEGLAWSYESETDRMTGRVVKAATINSTNVVNFDFPYQGVQRGRLELRLHPRYGRNVILDIDKGQFLCRIDGCTVSIRFDEAKPQTFSAAEPADHSTTALFIRDYGRFLSQVRRAKKIAIEQSSFSRGREYSSSM